MAYMNQEMKKELAPKIKEVLKKYNVKGTISVENYSTLIVTIRSGPYMFAWNDTEHNKGSSAAERGYVWFTVSDGIHFQGEEKLLLDELNEVMNVGNYDKSDAMSDYFDIGWISRIRIGEFDKNYNFVG